MRFTERINKWFKNFRRYFFTYKDGFFELCYLANSPQAIVHSIIKMPFVKHSAQDQTIESSNPFVQGIMHYQEIEDGLWMMHGKFEYKANVNLIRMDDEFLPSDYYFLSLEVAETEDNLKPALINGVPYTNQSWLLFKPKASTANCHFKGAKETSFTAFFSKKWVKEVLIKSNELKNSNLKHFFNSEAKYIIWPDTMEATDAICKSLVATFNKKGNEGVADFQQLKKLTYDFIHQFIRKYDSDEVNKHFFEIPDNERKKIMKAERLLTENLCTDFVGLDALAQQVGLSSTVLKNRFKMVYGQPVYQYFRGKQMHYAQEILKEKKHTVKEVAHMLGYENPSKFTAAFKKHLGVLPSQLENSISTKDGKYNQ